MCTGPLHKSAVRLYRHHADTCKNPNNVQPDQTAAPPLHIGLPDGAPCHSDDECRNGPCNALDDLAPAVGDELLHGDLARLYATSNLELDQQIASQDLRHIHKEIAQPQP